MKALVTGSTGCLGINLVKRLLELGWKVFATGRNLTIGNILETQGAIFYKANLEDSDAIIKLCKDIDIVFHCGALSAPWGKYQNFYNANVLGTKNIIAGCLKHKVKRLVYVSTPSLYFDFKTKHQIREVDPLPSKPVNFYIETKKMAEQLIDKAFFENNLAVITIRPRAIFGPHDTAIVPRIIRAAKKEKLLLINNGEALIDVTYVENVVEGLVLSATTNQSFCGKKYNITNDEPIKLRRLLERLFFTLGQPFNPQTIAYYKAYSIAAIMEMLASLPLTNREPLLTRYGVGILSFGQTLNIEMAKKDLGYKPKISIEEGLKRFSKWWKKDYEKVGL